MKRERLRRALSVSESCARASGGSEGGRERGKRRELVDRPQTIMRREERSSHLLGLALGLRLLKHLRQGLLQLPQKLLETLEVDLLPRLLPLSHRPRSVSWPAHWTPSLQGVSRKEQVFRFEMFPNWFRSGQRTSMLCTLCIVDSGIVRAQVDFPCWGGRGRSAAVQPSAARPAKYHATSGRTHTEKTGAVEAPPSRTETPRTKLEVRRTQGRGGGRGPGRSASRAPTICHRAFDSSKTVGARTPRSREVHATSSVADFRVQGGRPPGAPPRDAPSCFTNFG